MTKNRALAISILLYQTVIYHGVVGFTAGWNIQHAYPMNEQRTTLHGVSRRNIFGGAIGSALVGNKRQKVANAATLPSSTKSEPLADLPMVRLQLPKNGFGREYVAMKLKIQGKVYEFMVDSGLTTEMITPHAAGELGIGGSKKKIVGLGAGGDTTSNSIVNLENVSLCCGDFENDAIELPLPTLHAVITDFPQEHIDPAHDPVEGMIGMELLSLFDVEFDFENNRIKLWRPGTAVTDKLVEIPAVVINETGLIGIRVTVPGASQPILGFLDCGSTFSCMNWKAAAQLGLPSKDDKVYANAPSVAAVGIDGRLISLPTKEQTISFAGDVKLDSQTGKPIGFEKPPMAWKDWDPVRVAIGDLPAFSSILGDGVLPYDGPAALIGLDVLSQRRLILQAGTDKTRRRRVFVSPS